MKILNFNKTYIRIFIIVVFLFASSTIIFAASLSKLVSDYNKSQLGGFYEDKVYQTARNLENALERTKFYALNMYSNYEINRWFYDVSNDKLLVQSVFHTVLNYKITDPYIKDITSVALMFS